MKRLFIICALFPLVVQADIIVTRSNGNIEDVKVVSMTPENVLYTQNGQAKSIPSGDVDGVLYDDGRYVSPPKKSQEPQNFSGSVETSGNNNDWNDGSDISGNMQMNGYEYNQNTFSGGGEYVENRGTNEFNILAYGKPILNFYTVDHDYDGAKVEYRAITRSNPNPEFEYLGTTPFAYVTETEAKVLSALDKKVANIIQVRPLSAEKGAKLEFRISKNGNSIIVSPMVKVDFGGRIIALPLNKLKNGNTNASNKQQRVSVGYSQGQYDQCIKDMISYSETHPAEWKKFAEYEKISIKLNKKKLCWEQGTAAYTQATMSGLSGDAAVEMFINAYASALYGSQDQPMPVNPYSGGGTTGGDNW